MTSKYPDKLQVNVTQEHIDNGEPGRGASCPIALALRAHPLTTGDRWQVTRISAYSYEPYSPTYTTSHRAARFINRFDNELPVEPSTFVFTKDKREAQWTALHA